MSSPFFPAIYPHYQLVKLSIRAVKLLRYPSNSEWQGLSIGTFFRLIQIFPTGNQNS